MTETVYLGIGSNVQPERHVGIAIERLAAQFGTLRLSPLYWSPSVGFTGHDFINAVAAVETTMAPLAVRNWLRALEDEHGRQRDVPKFSDRVLDVDILLFGQRIRTEQPLILPRGEVFHFAHVLRPLAELAPELTCPGDGRRFAQIRNDAALDESGLRQLTPDEIPAAQPYLI